jgi:hypothetical protein
MTKRKKINYNKEESKINKEYSKCVGKVGKSVWQKYTYKRPPTLKNLPVKDRWKAINASRKAFKKTHTINVGPKPTRNVINTDVKKRTLCLNINLKKNL